jgi:flagellar hook-length control protein FliK
MHLTRVTAKGLEHAKAAASGGNADVLALLLGGDQSAGSAFPATLEAALGDGDTPDEPLAVGDAEAASDDGPAADDGTPVVDVALAAALALAGVPTDATPAAGAVAATVAGAAQASAGASANTVGSAATAIAAAPGASGKGTFAGAASAATTVAAAAEAKAAASADATGTASQGSDARTAGAASADAKTDGSTLTGTTASTAGTAVAASSAPHELASARAATATSHADGTTPSHGAGAGVDAERAPTFASDAGAEHGLDLGSSARDDARLVVEKPAHAPAPATPAGSALEAPHQLRPSNDAVHAGVANAQVTASTSPPASVHETVAPAHHAGDLAPRWSDRVVDALRLSALRGGGEIRLQLEPEGLGHIDVRLRLQSDGVRAVIVAEHESTRALLTSQQQVLHDAFTRSDIRLSGFSVDVGADGGAASFTRSEDGGQGNAAPTPEPPPTAATDADERATANAGLASGHVSVRV